MRVIAAISATLVVLAALAIAAGAAPTPSARQAAHLSDSYKSFRYRVIFDGRVVAGFNKAGGLEQGAPRRGTRHEPVTFERGVTHDAEFEKWAMLSLGLPTNELKFSDAKKDIVIEAVDEAGKVALSTTLRHSWVSKYQAVPDLDANANDVAIEHMTIEHEGLERKP